MGYPAGQYYMDGKDLFLVYGVIVEKGMDDLLKIPDRKDSIEHDWKDENGLDVDLSRVFFEAREVSLQCAILADTDADFFNKYTGFIAMLAQPDLRRLEVSSLSRSFYVFYKSCTSWVRETKVRGRGEGEKIGFKFTITFIEKNPTIDSSNVFMITDDNMFMIT